MKRVYIPPQVREITPDDIASVEPVLMSGCYGGCYSSCYSSCYASSYTPATPKSGAAYVLLNDRSLAVGPFPIGHVAIGLALPSGSFRVYSFGPWDNASAKADAVVNTAFINGSQGYLESYSQFSDLCRCQEFRLSNPFYPQTGSGDSFVEKFRRSMKFTLTSAKIDSILGYAESVKKNPGTYNVASNNCLMFVTHAFAAAGFLFVAQSGDELTDLANAPALWFQSIYGIKTSGGKISKYSNIDDFYD